MFWSQVENPSGLYKGKQFVSIETLVDEEGGAKVRVYDDNGATLFSRSFESVSLAGIYVAGIKDALVNIAQWHLS